MDSKPRGWPNPPDETEPDIFDILEAALAKNDPSPFLRESELSAKAKRLAMMRRSSKPTA